VDEEEEVITASRVGVRVFVATIVRTYDHDFDGEIGILELLTPHALPSTLLIEQLIEADTMLSYSTEDHAPESKRLQLPAFIRSRKLLSRKELHVRRWYDQLKRSRNAAI
jgi:hypothetical protein